MGREGAPAMIGGRTVQGRPAAPATGVSGTDDRPVANSLTPDSSVNPILCDPYSEPHRHWELDHNGRATDRIVEGRRLSSPSTPVVPGKTSGSDGDAERTHARINDLRHIISEWRKTGWEGATSATKMLLAHWQEVGPPKLYWAQLEAIETIVWLYEVAPSSGEGRKILDEIRMFNVKYNSDGESDTDGGIVLERLASKMATGTGKTTVMAMIIAWHGCNAAIDPERFASQFVVMSPSTTIRKRLAELDPHTSDSVYKSMDLLPPTISKRMADATVVVRTYHAFQQHDILARMGAGAREKRILTGRGDRAGDGTREGAGEMVRRVAGRGIDFGRPFLIINDEAHHCYKPGSARVREVRDSDAKKAALWYSAIRHMMIEGMAGNGIGDGDKPERGMLRGIYDLSATPRFIERGEARTDSLFPWTVSDFPLTDSIECGMVKIPRVPVGKPLIDKTLCRNIFANTDGDRLSADNLPDTVQRPLEALYANYKDLFMMWERTGQPVPPVFVIVANTIDNANELARFVSAEGGVGSDRKGKFSLFTNRQGEPVRTLLVHSSLADGDLTDAELKKLSVGEMADRLGRPGEGIDAIREALDTVGKKGHLGEHIRCVVSVAMLTEGWDARNVTHIFGFRRFGTQLICEQVVGRALRRHDTEYDGWYNEPSYADIFGVPFSYMLEPTKPTPPEPPGLTVQADASDDDLLAIDFPMVTRYDMIRSSDVDVKIDEGRVRPYVPNEEMLEGVMGNIQGIDMPKCPDLQSAVYAIATEAVKRYADDIRRHAEDASSADRVTLFTRLVPAVFRWLDLAVEDAESKSKWLCSANNMDAIVEGIRHACLFSNRGTVIVPRPVVESVSSTRDHSYTTVVKVRGGGEEEVVRAYLHPTKCSHTAAAFDSALEVRVAKMLDKMPAVRAWMRNHRRVGWRLPYYSEARWRMYYPDFVARVDAGDGADFFCIVEAKGQDSDEARAKAYYAGEVWTKAVGSVLERDRRKYGRWAFVQVGDEGELAGEIEAARKSVVKSA